jgi:hypothetical protein
MKKAKIFLTGLAVLAVVGGALAFKAKQSFVYYSICDTLAVPKVCTLGTLTTFATTQNGVFDATYAPFGTPCPNNVCKTKTIASN